MDYCLSRQQKTVKARRRPRRGCFSFLCTATAFMLLDFGMWKFCEGFNLSPSFPLSVSLPHSTSTALPASSIAYPHPPRTIAFRSLHCLPRRSSIQPPSCLGLVAQENDLYQVNFAMCSVIPAAFGPDQRTLVPGAICRHRTAVRSRFERETEIFTRVCGWPGKLFYLLTSALRDAQL